RLCLRGTFQGSRRLSLLHRDLGVSGAWARGTWHRYAPVFGPAGDAAHAGHPHGGGRDRFTQCTERYASRKTGLHAHGHVEVGGFQAGPLGGCGVLAEAALITRLRPLPAWRLGPESLVHTI